MSGDDRPTEQSEPSRITRRSVLAASSSAAIGLAAFSGTAAAHEVSTIAFCGCTQVTVYGVLLDDSGVDYEAVVYCDGETTEKPLSGDDTRQNYNLDEDDDVTGDCQIIAVKGTTYPYGEFTVCNEHCPANCARKGLADAALSCDDPDDVTSGGGSQPESIPEQTITVQCSGCGRSEPGNPGKGKRKGRKKGRQ